LETSPSFHHYQNNWILPEDSIFSSQPSLFLLDMENEVKKQEVLNSTLLSVIIDEDQSDGICHPIHGRPDCVFSPFKKEPRLHCETCWCIICEVPAAKCKHWDVHCKKAKKQVNHGEVEQIKSGSEKKKTNKKTKTGSVSKEEVAAPVVLKKEKAVELDKHKAGKSNKAAVSKEEVAAPVVPKKEKNVESDKHKAEKSNKAAVSKEEVAAPVVLKKEKVVESDKHKAEKSNKAAVSKKEVAAPMVLKKEKAVELDKYKAGKSNKAAVSKGEVAAPVALKIGMVGSSGKEKAAKSKKAAPGALKKEIYVASKKEKNVVLSEEIASPVASKKEKACNIEGTEKMIAAVKNNEVEGDEKKFIGEQLKDYLSTILEMDAATLKDLCKEKGILSNGPSTLKHKYTFALFRDALI
jgi:hypothetical protein